MDGYETTRRIRGFAGNQIGDREQWMTVPILAMTAHAMPSDRAKSLQAGMNDHLSKPIDPQALFVTLLKWIPPRPQFPASDLSLSPLANNADHHRSLSDIPPIPGLNFNAGITRLAGNQGAYCRLLQQFHLTYQSFPERLQTLFETQQFDEIINQIHALKGVSGNLGAETLHRTLCSFSQALKQTDPPPNLSLYHDRVQEIFAALLQDLADSPLLADKGQFLASSNQTSRNTEKVPLQLLLKSFSELLDQDLGAAIAVFEQLQRQENRSELQPLLVAIETELENFNLDSVNQHLQVLTTHLDLPNHNGNSPVG